MGKALKENSPAKTARLYSSAHLTGEKLHQLEQNLGEIYAFRELLPI